MGLRGRTIESRKIFKRAEPTDLRVARIERALEHIGIDFENSPEGKKKKELIVDRLIVLPTILRDEARNVGYMDAVMNTAHRYFRLHPDSSDHAFCVTTAATDDPQQQEHIRTTLEQASFLADIGKSGPVGASDLQQAIIAAIYENDVHVPDRSITMDQFIDQYMDDRGLALSNDTRGELVDHYGMDPADIMPAQQIQVSPTMMKEILASTKVDLVNIPVSEGKPPKNLCETTFQQFIRQHATWSYEILKAAGMAQEVAEAAGAHHYLDGDNPVIDREGHRVIAPDAANLSLLQKWIIVFDKFDAAIERTPEIANMTDLGEKFRAAAKKVLDILQSNYDRGFTEKNYAHDPEILGTLRCMKRGLIDGAAIAAEERAWRVKKRQAQKVSA